MRKTILFAFALIAFLNFSALAQKEMLTKEETINYLNKKIKEAEGLGERAPHTKFIKRYKNLFVQMKGDEVEIGYTDKLWRQDGEPSPSSATRYTYSFNPAYLESAFIMDGTYPDSEVKKLMVTFSAKTVKHKLDNMQFGPYNYLPLPFFASLPENESKIRKALMHLRDLAKAEDDPFGN